MPARDARRVFHQPHEVALPCRGSHPDEMGKSDANLGTVATHLGFPSHYRTEKSLGPMCYCGNLHN
jgi:hypothetical protein